MKANKKFIQQQLTEETGKIILLKDLTNISTSMKEGKSRNDLDKSIGTLKDKYGRLESWLLLRPLRPDIYKCM